MASRACLVGRQVVENSIYSLVIANVVKQSHTMSRLELHIKKNQYFYNMIRGGVVYILTNQGNTTLYTGVTSNIVRRLYEHRTGVYKKSFTSKYALNKLVYYEVFHRIEDAITREKQIKAGSRLKKENLIISINPNWNDLSKELGVE